MIHNGISEMAANSKAAQQLGLSYNALATIEMAAGNKVEEMRGALGKLSVHFGELQAGSQEAADKFNRLGISANEIKGLGLEDAFRRITQRIAELPTPAERAYAAHQLFGKGAEELVGVMTKLGMSWEQIKGLADTYGRTVDENTLKQARNLALAEQRYEMSKKFAAREAAKISTGPLTWITEGLGVILSGSSGPDFYKNMQARQAQVTDQLSETTEAAKSAGVQASTFRDSIDALNRSLNTQFAILGMTSEQIEVYKATLDKAQTAEQKTSVANLMSDAADVSAQKLNFSLKQQIDRFGMTARQADAYTLSMASAAEGIINLVKEQDEHLTRLEREAKLFEESQGLISGSMSALDQFRETYQKLIDGENRGDINRNQANSAIEKAYKQAAGSLGTPQALAPTAEFGSAAAASSINRVAAREAGFGAPLSVEATIKALDKKAAAELEQANLIRQQLERSMNSGPTWSWRSCSLPGSTAPAASKHFVVAPGREPDGPAGRGVHRFKSPTPEQALSQDQAGCPRSRGAGGSWHGLAPPA